MSVSWWGPPLTAVVFFLFISTLLKTSSRPAKHLSFVFAPVASPTKCEKTYSPLFFILFDHLIKSTFIINNNEFVCSHCCFEILMRLDGVWNGFRWNVELLMWWRHVNARNYFLEFNVKLEDYKIEIIDIYN